MTGSDFTLLAATLWPILIVGRPAGRPGRADLPPPPGAPAGVERVGRLRRPDV